MKTRFGILALGLVFMFCSACGNGGAHRRPGLQNPVGPPQEYPQETSGANNPGSLFAASDGDTLFSDARARRVGDIVVVKLVENTKAQNKTETQATKQSNNSYSVNAFFNVPKIAGVIPVGTPTLDTSATSDFTSTQGKTKRENYVTTSMAARVIRVLPGGMLQIEGAREIRVNEETEYMVVRGLIRAKDVDAENSILSTQIADASIEYYGKGVLSDKQKPGWFTRLMDNIWPF